MAAMVRFGAAQLRGALLCAALAAASAQAAAPRVFGVGERDGRWWFIDPAGEPFLSLGVSSLRASPPGPCPGGARTAEATWQRLRGWGFNTSGPWSNAEFRRAEFPYAVVLDLAPGEAIESKLDRVFSIDFEAAVRGRAQAARELRDDPWLLGYFLDNELPWWGETGWPDEGRPTLLEKYARAGTDDENKEALIAFLQERHGSLAAFESIWRSRLGGWDDLRRGVPLIARTRAQKADARAWAGRVAERYFAVTVPALREVDPHHLILGVRFAGEQIPEVVEACGRSVDVVSVNHYSPTGDVDPRLLDDLFALTGKPLLISEYSFRATENRSGNRNRRGPEVTVPTQAARAEHAGRFAGQALDRPWVVGLHWFSWEDQPAEGRFDGEDSNLGLVDVDGCPYEPLVEAHVSINASAVRRHAAAATEYPRGPGASPRATYRRADEQAVAEGRVRIVADLSRPLRTATWGHAGYGGRAAASQREGSLVVDYETGEGWGCGVTLEPDRPVSRGAVDLRGYDTLVVEAFAPSGVRFSVFLTESGAGPPRAGPYVGADGADGESYALPALIGHGRWVAYPIALDELESRREWGNQEGNRVLDLQAVAGIDLHVSGGQGEGRLLVRRIDLVRREPGGGREGASAPPADAADQKSMR